MANRAKLANIRNHKRQLAYLKAGIVMLPKRWEELRAIRSGRYKTV